MNEAYLRGYNNWNSGQYKNPYHKSTPEFTQWEEGACEAQLVEASDNEFYGT